jgi:hypothetical protein
LGWESFIKAKDGSIDSESHAAETYAKAEV